MDTLLQHLRYAQAAYWRQALDGAPELLELPADRPRPARPDPASGAVELALGAELAAGLGALGRRHGTTPFTPLLAAWAVVLSRLSGQRDVVIGTQAASPGWTGARAGTLPVRIDLTGAPTVAELLERVDERVRGAWRHQELPFDEVVEAVRPVRSAAHTPLFQVAFAWREEAGGAPSLPGLMKVAAPAEKPAPRGAVHLPGLRIAAAEVPEPGAARVDLSLELAQVDGRIAGRLEYAAALFDAATVRRYAGYLRRVLAGMVADDGCRVDRIELMPADERARVVEEWNRTAAEYPAGTCIHQLFQAQAARTPDAVALVHETDSLTYAELNARANRLAHHLVGLGVGPEVRVGVCLERGVELVVSLMAVLKAGGAYVPLDPAYPAERLRLTLADAGVGALITQEKLRDLLAVAPGVAVVIHEQARAEVAARSPENPEAGAAPRNLAYLIYTSGSTGVPKGVAIEHESAVVMVAWAWSVYSEEDFSGMLASTSICFDMSVYELFATLTCGGRVIVVENALALPHSAAADQVRLLDTVPSAAAALLKTGGIPASVRTVNLGGEPLEAELVDALYAHGVERVYDVYGPSEDTTFSTCALRQPGGPVTIGRVLSNSQAYVLDDALQPLPVGVPGELYLGGKGVTRGYLGRPGLTAGRYVPDPFSAEPGARMYRTGDRIRWKADGTLEYLGRFDHQVKIRGFRVEIGEVEAVLRRHPDVRECVVLAREDVPGGRRLVAYVVGAGDADAPRAHLAEHLPEYMVPAAFVRLEALPLTPNGKLDRRALPAPAWDAAAAGAYEAPAGAVEAVVAECWAELLGVAKVGRRAHFLELGGHSLLAVQVVSRVRQQLGVEVAPGELFARPVLADFARGLQSAARAGLSPIQPVDRGRPLAPSFAQARLWFLEQLGGTGSAYHIAERLRLRGPLDRAALVRALDRIVARHEPLRTVFAQVDGHPVQRVAPAETSAFRLVEHDLRGHPGADAESRRLTVQEADAPFDLERGPLIRGRLLRLADEDHLLLLTMHHVVSDGWSMGVIARELDALYGAYLRGAADPLPALPVQYADYAAWHRRRVAGELLEAQAAYWTRTLAGAPELLELPLDRPRPARQDHAGAVVRVELDAELTAQLKALSRRGGTTLFMTLLAGWAAVLGRLSGQDDVVVGLPTANRGVREIEGLIGFFVNTLAVRVDLSGAPGVGQVLERVRARVLEAQQNQDIPFEQVVERVRPVRSLSHSALFQAMFAWQGFSGSGWALPGLAVATVDASEHGTALCDLSLSLDERDGRIVGGLEYRTSLFDAATVQRYAGYLARVLREMAADEGACVDRLTLLPEDERRLLVEGWSAGGGAPAPGPCVHERFQAQAARTPDAAAVEFEGATLTYARLNARANRLAHHLLALGVGPGARVALCLERGPEMMAAVLGVLKTGAAYVPLDPAYPEDRLRYTLEDSNPAVVLTQASLAERFAGAGVPVLDVESPAWSGAPEGDPPRAALTAADVAYVIYTSGSTGRPKGVCVEHGALAATLAVAGDAFGFGAGDRAPSLASFAFDIWLFESLLPLLAGGTVRMVPRERVLDVPGLVAELAACTVLHAVPALMRGIVAEVRASTEGGLRGMRRVFVGGEAVAPDLLEEMRGAFPAAEIRVLYGPTEAAIICASHRLEREPAARQMVGRPLGNAAMYVLDGALRPVPVGVAGELCLGEPSVARGYLGRPGLTAERFVPDALSGRPGARLYRTGDRVRWLASGALEFLGRTDRQVKLRGFRIEPGEIEARLAQHPGVLDALVEVRGDGGARRLVAYCRVREGAAPGAEALRAHLGETLPEYMVPAAYVELGAWPLTPNGKVDRAALPEPGDAHAAQAYEAPADGVESALAAIWSDVLGVERVGRRDHFFELGGHSLLAVQVVSRVRQALAVEAAIGDVFVQPVLMDYARTLAAAAAAKLPPILPVERGGELPLSFAQQRLWFLEQLEGSGSAYNVPTRLRLRGVLDREALVRALDCVVARHEALRTVFVVVDGKPEQRIAPAGESGFRLVDHDLAGHADAEGELRRLMALEAEAGFALEHGPLIRGRLVRLGADEHVLLVTLHHIVSDGWSMGVLTRELSALYAAFLRGEPDPLPPLAVQYADYAAWQRRWVDGPVLQEQADFWTRSLAGAPVLLELPSDRPRPPRQDYAGATLPFALDAELSAGLRALGRRHGATLFMTLLAGWSVVLSRLSGQRDVVVGVPAASRGRREIEGLIGFFVNTLALRMELDDAPTVAQLLERVKARALGAQQNQDIPFDQVVERVQPARSLAHGPLFQVLFAWQNAPGGPLQLPGLTLEPVEAPDEGVTSKFDLSLELAEADGRIAGELTYATALFDRATAERHLGYLRRVLRGMVADEHRPVERLEVLSDAERAQVVESWNATDAAYPAESCIHQLFEAQADRTPDVVAVSFDGRALSYAELNARANRLAHELIARGVGPDVRVGVCMDRGVEMVVSLFAILKAGGGYVPLDPEAPEERLRAMLADSAPAVLLTQSSLRGRFDGLQVPVVAMDTDATAWADRPAANPAIEGLGPDHLAYVIYTSGSTGTPKGVMNAHRGVVNRLAWMEREYRLGAHEAVLQKTPYSFDVSVWEFFWPLMTGARLVMARPGGHKDPAYLVDTIRAESITTLHFVPSMLRAFLEAEGVEACASVLRRVVCSGEALPAALVRRFHERLPSAELHNLYGPTEAAVDVTAWRCVVGESDVVPIGRPMANVRIYLLDGQMAPVPAGVAGELYIGGIQVARGYLNRAGLTAGRFVPDPFANEPGVRLYRTGDLARWLADGSIEYLGRNDFQVKVRGFRIELGEIEARLAEHADVREAVVLAREDGAGEKRLVAYVVGDVDADVLRTHLSARLPEYMVPAAYVRMESMPLTSSGKLDRRALPAPEGDAYARRGYEAPVSRTETAVAEIWGEVLGVARVGRRDHFFDLGGHSLLAVRVVARLAQVLNARVMLADVFAHPTVDALAAWLDGARSADRGDLAVPIRASGTARPLFVVHEGTGSIAYAQVLRPHIDAEVPLYGLPATPRTDPIPRNVQEMAARHARMVRQVQPEGPYRLAGWSFGGVLAWELAAQLAAEGETVEFLGMLDTYHPASIPPEGDETGYNLRLLLLALFRLESGAPVVAPETMRELKTSTAGKDLPFFVDRAHAMGLLPAHVDLAQATYLQRHLQARFRAIVEYVPRPLSTPAHLFLTADPGADQHRGWKGTPASESLWVVPVPGTHQSMLGAGNVEVLGTAISCAIRMASRGLDRVSG